MSTVRLLSSDRQWVWWRVTFPSWSPGGCPESEMSETSEPQSHSSRKSLRPVWAQIDLDALVHNVRLLRSIVGPAELCAVVKADGYGHGAVMVGRAALEGGARWLAVATVEEGVELRDARIDAPVLLLSEPPPDAMTEVVRASLVPTLYSVDAIAMAQKAAATSGAALEVHVKVDTGMHRVGAASHELEDVLCALGRSDALRLGGFWTHLAVADGETDEDREYTARQLQHFAKARKVVTKTLGKPPLAHAANSAAAIAFPDSRLEMVRCGIAIYGSLPAESMGDVLSTALARAKRSGSDPPLGEGLRPVMSLRARVTHVAELDAGERPSYGRMRALAERSVVATVPIGYADGVPRRYFTNGGTVLVGGSRRPLAGAVTMDQIMIDCGPGSGVRVGDEVVLMGAQGDQRISAWDWAEVLGTISYEVLARIGPRVKRVYVPESSGGGEP
jgi:alanine racemase